MLKAVDVGFGRVKAMSEHKAIEFPSVVGNFRPIRFSSGMEDKDLVNHLCLDYAGQKYFAGNIAYQQSQARVTMSADRFTSKEGLALMFGALVVLSHQNDCDVNLVTGLPVNEYAAGKVNYREHLLGRHSIKLISPDGTSGTTYIFDLNDVKVLPQPVGTIFDAVLDDKGELKDKTLAGGRIAVLDIGRNTVDLAMTDKLSFIDRQSVSYDDIGLDDAYRELSLELKKSLGVNIPPESIEPYIVGNEIEYKGKRRSIEAEKRIVFQGQAEKIVSRALNVWKDIWQINQIIVTGGGAVMLGSYIANALNAPDQVQVYQGGDASFSNVRGFYKFGRRAWK
jgi:plasmid segregation protein ParM